MTQVRQHKNDNSGNRFAGGSDRLLGSLENNNNNTQIYMLNAYVNTVRGACEVIHNECDNNDDDSDYSYGDDVANDNKHTRSDKEFQIHESECLESNKCIALGHRPDILLISCCWKIDRENSI